LVPKMFLSRKISAMPSSPLASLTTPTGNLVQDQIQTLKLLSSPTNHTMAPNTNTGPQDQSTTHSSTAKSLLRRVSIKLYNTSRVRLRQLTEVLDHMAIGTCMASQLADRSGQFHNTPLWFKSSITLTTHQISRSCNSRTRNLIRTSGLSSQSAEVTPAK
jgi:hypothetical protein